jgi:transcriptional regulator with XRE-family HTH domain
MAGENPFPEQDEDSDVDWFGEDVATFGDRLAGAREAAGLTQEELARRLGVREETLRAWEDDLSEPRANRVQMLAGMLGVSMTWLMVGKGEGPAGPLQDGTAGQREVEQVLREMRALRVEMSRNLDRLGRLEGRLRRMAELQA